ncbi:GNAT family N-acetyltransferase [Halalkalibacter okhensis]|uniref:GNAT family acetyltransferase n=1 Tax=Halalkalibacter okhensis TaxID=333138 RepID=A0A0B0IFR3_9BACI|nr:GNAT family N-acetyltransferase [Halalkalibacter okhensis]KHF39727.1 GNAT family acetyltransferase [Halalkalibacter okhensis]
MKIEVCNHNEIDALIDIWYQGSIQSHHFISKHYWYSQKYEMRNKYIPMSETYVIYHQSKVVGFVSMVDNYLAALFIDTPYQRNGYGKELINFIKRKKSNISLKVYTKNKSAVAFYKKNDFIIKETLLDENTNQEEYLMEWNKT